MEWRILKACDYGTPTIRKRFYLIARCDGQPIVFPKPTHGKSKGLKQYRTAADCIDMSLPCPSIFGRKRGLAVNTLRRIARGMDKFVIKNPNPFIMQVNFGNPPQDVDNPLSTVTGVNKHYLAKPQLSPYIMSNNTNNACHSTGEPLPTVTTGNRNFVCAGYISKYFSGEKQVGADMREPCPTVTGIDHNALVAANVVPYYGGADHASAMQNPLPAVTALPRHYLTESHLCVLRNNMDCKGMDEPFPTVTAKEHEAVVCTYLQKIDSSQNLGHWIEIRNLLNNYAGYTIADDEILILEIDGVQYLISDIGMRMLKARELMLAQGFPEDYCIDIESKTGKKYSEAKQIARLGNAVCPPVAEALVRANCADIAARNKIITMAQLEQEISASYRRTARKRA